MNKKLSVQPLNWLPMHHDKLLFMSYTDNKGTEQPVYPRSLISAFVIHSLDSIIPVSEDPRLASYHISLFIKKNLSSGVWDQLKLKMACLTVDTS